MEEVKEVNDTEISNGEEAQKSNIQRDNNVNKLYNFISLAIAILLFAAQIYIFSALSSGFIWVYGLKFNSTEITKFFQFGAVVGFKSTSYLVKLVAIILYALYYLVVFILTLIGLIKTVIGVFGFFKVNKEYSAVRIKLLKYGKTVLRSYAYALSFVAVSFISGNSVTGLAKWAIAIGTIIYVGLSAFNLLYAEDGFNKNWIDMAFRFAAKLIMLMFAFMLVSNIKSGLFEALESTFNGTEPTFSKTGRFLSMFYLKLLRYFVVLVPYSLAIASMVIIAGNYALETGKKNSDYTLRNMFIALLVFCIVVSVADCCVYGAYYKAGAGEALSNMFFKNWFGFILVCAGGIVLTQFSVKQLKR